MAEAPSDWKVQVDLDRRALVEDITKLAQILARQRTFCVVSAVSEAEALTRAEEHLKVINGIQMFHVKAMYARKLPT